LFSDERVRLTSNLVAICLTDTVLAAMTDPNRVAALRAKMLEHLEPLKGAPMRRATVSPPT
jgi:hypothetical protein